jgi:uncharacterized membrane protein YciS (DUF1049 family)
MPGDRYDWLFLEDAVPKRVRDLTRSSTNFVFWSTVAAFLFGTIAIELARVARATVNWLVISATLNVPMRETHGFVPLVSKAKHVYGYFGELNHGVFYLVIAPTFICLSLLFCRSVGLMIADMMDSGLISETRPGYLAEKVRKLNSRIRWVFPGALVVFVAFNGWQELASLIGLDERLDVRSQLSQTKAIKESKQDEEQKSSRWEAIGYVQTNYLKLWCNFFNGANASASPPFGRAYELEGFVFGDAIRTDLGRQLDILSKTDSIDIRSFLADRVLRIEDGQNLVISREGLQSLERNGLVHFHADGHGGFKDYGALQNTLHGLFLAYVLILEGCFHGFVFWVLVKIIVFMVILHDLVPDQGDWRVSVLPFFYDPEKRYGLDQLFRCYNQIAVLIALGASFLILISMNTIEAHSSHQPFRFMSMLNFLGFIAIVLALLILIAGPFLFASRSLRHRQADEIRKLNRQLETTANARDLQEEKRDKQYSEISEKLRLVKAQTTWPRTDATFLAILGFCLVALAFPFPTLEQLGKQAEQWTTLAKAVEKTFHALISPD